MRTLVARIAGVNIPTNKPIGTALTYIYGIGRFLANKICDDCNIDKAARTYTLTVDDVTKIRKRIVDNGYVVEGDLRKKVRVNIKFLMDIRCHRGIRHQKNLPVRGQRTRTNGRTRKGRSNLPIAAKKK